MNVKNGSLCAYWQFSPVVYCSSSFVMLSYFVYRWESYFIIAKPFYLSVAKYLAKNGAFIGRSWPVDSLWPKKHFWTTEKRRELLRNKVIQ